LSTTNALVLPPRLLIRFLCHPYTDEAAICFRPSGGFFAK